MSDWVTLNSVSDVWQGPGWWLASDGKWYPADAEPGAVYEGDVSSTSDEPVSAGVDAQVATSPEAPMATSPEPTLTQPDSVPASPTALPDPYTPDMGSTSLGDPIVEPVHPEPAASFAAPTAAPEISNDLPDPEPQTSSGGWQNITTDPAPAPEVVAPTAPAPEVAVPAAAAPAPAPEVPAPTASAAPEAGSEAPEEDGWTSAYDERQTVSEILGAADSDAPSDSPLANDARGSSFFGGAAATPDVSMPDMAAPDVSIPDVDTPTVASTNIADLYSDESKTQPNPGPEPVERDGAWRRPTKAPLTGRVGMAATADAPQVVDLAVPQPLSLIHISEPTRPY